MYDDKQAKKDMLKELKKEMRSGDDMGLSDMMDSMQKITIAADSEEGLKKGLSKAEEILNKRKSKKEDKDESCPGCGMEDCECVEEAEEMSKDDLKKKISKLEKMLKKSE